MGVLGGIEWVSLESFVNVKMGLSGCPWSRSQRTSIRNKVLT